MRAILAVALMLFVTPTVFAADKPEPKYEGKPLEYWVTRFQKAETYDQRTEAATAIKKFGPDAAPAVPKFIEMLADLSPAYRSQVIDILGAIGPKAEEARPVIVKLLKEDKSHLYEGIPAIVAISSSRKDAVPVVSQFLEVADDGWIAFMALRDIGSDAKEALPAIRKYAINELANKKKFENGKYQGCLYDLHAFGPDVVPLLVELLDGLDGAGRDVALDCLQKLGLKAKSAAPALMKLLKHDDPATQFRAAFVLWTTDRNAASIRACAQLLNTDLFITCASPTDTRPYPASEPIAVRAARLLGEIGPEAKAALPQLRATVAVGSTFWLLSDGHTALFPAPPSEPQVVPATYYPTAGRPTGTGVIDEEYRNARGRIEVARAALEAIAKIEAKPMK